MNVVVDFDRCEAQGACMKTAPEVFLLDEQDRLHLLVHQVPDELRVKVEQAVHNCPRQALSLSRD